MQPILHHIQKYTPDTPNPYVKKQVNKQKAMKTS